MCSDYRQLFDRVTLDLGPSSRAAAPVDQRVAAFAVGRRSGPRGALLPVRALPAHLQLAAGLAARQPTGDLERQPVAAVGQQVHDQHQHPDELLAGAVHEPRRDDGPAHGHGAGSRPHRRATRRARCTARAAGSRITTPISGGRQRRSTARSGVCGRRAARGWRRALGALRVQRRPRVSADHLPPAERSRAVLPRHARRRADGQVARHLSVALAREPASVRHVARRSGRRWTSRSCATCSPA